ncbi:MAG: DinB family protein [Chitinophagaceae bacterium]
MNKRKQAIFTYILLMLLIPIGIKAQAQDSLLNELSDKWKNAKVYTLKIAEMMPEEEYKFKPMADEMTFGEQLLHIAQNMTWLSSTYLYGSKEIKKQDTVQKSKRAIIQILSMAYDSALAVHYRVSSHQLEEVVPFFAGSMKRRKIFVLMHDHQTHHVGQLIVYLRLKGIKPPDYVGW